MSDPVSIETDMAPGFWWIGPEDNPALVENAEAGWQTSDCLDGFDVVERSEIAIIGKMEEIMSSTTLDGFDVIESGERG